VRAALPDGTDFLSHREAVALGRRLVAAHGGGNRGIFSIFEGAAGHRSGLPFALSSTVHAGLFAAIVFVFTFGPAPVATTLTTVDPPSDPMRLVFLDIPGPGGGGGGGGLLQKAPPPKAMREGRKKVSSPMPKRELPKPIEPVAAPPEPKPPAPLAAESLPVVVAPIVTAPADNRDRAGVLQQARSEAESRGPGQGGGAGTGRGTGVQSQLVARQPKRFDITRGTGSGGTRRDRFTRFRSGAERAPQRHLGGSPQRRMGVRGV